MNRSGVTGIIAAAIITLGVSSAAIAPAAQAAQTTQVTRVTRVTQTMPSAQSTVQVLTTRPGSLTIIGHRGQPVTVWTKGSQPITKRPHGTSPVTFLGLSSGRAYSVYVGPTMAAVVRTTTTAGAITDVVVKGGPDTSSLDVSWQVKLASGVTAKGMRFLVAATSPGAPRVSIEVTGTQHAIITGLRPDAVYAITVTPIRGTAAGTAKAWTMATTVAQAFAMKARPVEDLSAATAPVAPTSTAPPAPALTRSPSTDPIAQHAATPQPASPQPARPTTKTIYVCPAGYLDVAGRCQQEVAYTFHDVILTSDYTHHQEFIQTGSHLVFSTSPNGGTYYAQNVWNPSDGSAAGFYRMDADGYNVSVKDAPPAGYSDNGSQYSRTVQVKDAMPGGYLDDGSRWIATAPMEAKVVPA
jgi:hypothetical protein